MADKMLSEITEHDLFVAHLALEDVLVDMRDDRLSFLGPANGLVIREKDGSPSSVIRIGTRMAVKMAIDAILQNQTVPE